MTEKLYNCFITHEAEPPIPRPGPISYLRIGSWHLIGGSRIVNKNIYFAFYTEQPEVCIRTLQLPRDLQTVCSISRVWSGDRGSTQTQAGVVREEEGTIGVYFHPFLKEKAVENSEPLKTSANGASKTLYN